MTTVAEEQALRRIVAGASIALVAFSVLTTAALVAWFSRAQDPWNWKAAVAMFAAMFGLTMSGIVWRAPSRTTARIGIGIMAVSLVRIWPPWEWTWISATLAGVTVLLMIPLVHASIALR